MINNLESNAKLLAKDYNLVAQGVVKSLFGLDILFGKIGNNGVGNDVASTTNNVAIKRNKNISRNI
jgi:hypothetical protein